MLQLKSTRWKEREWVTHSKHSDNNLGNMVKQMEIDNLIQSDYRNLKNTGHMANRKTNSLHIQKEHYTPPRGSMSKSGTTTTRASPNATPKPWPGWKIDRMPSLFVQFWNANEYSKCILTVANPVAMFGLPGPHRQLPGKQHSPSHCASDMDGAMLLVSVRSFALFPSLIRNGSNWHGRLEETATITNSTTYHRQDLGFL